VTLLGASVFCQTAFRLCRPWLDSSTPRSRAGFLFAVRFLPVLLSGVVALGIALPSFLKFEPRSTGEAIGPKLTTLALAGAAVLLAMALRGVRLLHSTIRIQKQWQRRAREMQVEGCKVPIYTMDASPALFSVTGMVRPKVFVANAASQILSPEELAAALAHEMAHVRSRDNLKQLFLKTTRPPAWLDPLLAANADAGWAVTSEVAADEDALDSGVSVLDLSSALVKIGRLQGSASGPQMIASHFIPDGLDSCMQLRVAHLERRLTEGPRKKNRRSSLLRATVGCIVVAALVCAGGISIVLPWVHEMLEIIVR
jgi:beta-lactamase regulating signal transducer with metallopeptidase domain